MPEKTPPPAADLRHALVETCREHLQWLETSVEPLLTNPRLGLMHARFRRALEACREVCEAMAYAAGEAPPEDNDGDTSHPARAGAGTTARQPE